jgi:hypothetical protein
MLVQGMFGFFGLLTSYIIYKAVKKREFDKYMKKLEVSLNDASADIADDDTVMTWKRDLK